MEKASENDFLRLQGPQLRQGANPSPATDLESTLKRPNWTAGGVMTPPRSGQNFAVFVHVR